MTTSTDSIPDALTDVPQWVCWRTETRDGKPTKIPINPVTEEYAKVSDSETWAAYAAARTCYELADDVDGLGYVFTLDGPYAGIDLDDARDPVTGTVKEWAIDIILRLTSYTEVSPSGTGYHILVKGSVPDGGNRHGHVEMYDHNRYFTVTGDHVPGTPQTIEDRSNELEAIHRDYIVDSTEDNADTEPEETSDAFAPVALSDEELLEKAMNAANGEKFRRLWTGDTSGYPSHSEADQALCNLLAFWTGGDEHRIERLFAQSGLTRAKWQNRPDYRKRTIRNAVQDCPSYYDG